MGQDPGKTESAIDRSRMLIVGHLDGKVRKWDLQTGTMRWESQARHGDYIIRLMLSPDGRTIATTTTEDTRLWDASSGEALHSLGTPGYGIAWSADPQRLATASTGVLRIWNAETGTELFRREANASYGIALSRDARTLASSDFSGAIHVYDTGSAAELFRCIGRADRAGPVAFSSRGDRLASGNHNIVHIWDARSGEELAQCKGHSQLIQHIAFAPGDRVLTSVSDDHTIRFWDVVSGEEIHRITFPEGNPSQPSFSPDGAFLATGHDGVVARLWDTRFLLQASPVISQFPAEPLGPDLVALPSAWAALERAGVHLPLSLVRDLLALTAGQAAEPLSSLAEHPGVRRLAGLGWPAAARVGLVELLTHEIRDERWAPPASHGTAELRQVLEHALGGARVEARPAAVPLALLTQAAAEIDDRTLTLLHALGPDTVAADPSLVPTLHSQRKSLPALTASQRRLLDRPIRGLESGRAQGAGVGTDRGGIAPRGPLTAILSSQLVYPPELLALKYHDGGLLYRARTGSQQPDLRPTVLLLDVSPGCFGPVESLTRPAAFAIARALRRRAIPVRLVALGGQAKVKTLEHPRDLIELLTVRSFEPVDQAAALRTAERVASELAAQAGGSVSILLLTQPYWGIDMKAPAPTPGIRALFVQYPGQQVRPSFAAHCERWESIDAGESERLSQVLGRLVA